MAKALVQLGTTVLTACYPESDGLSQCGKMRQNGLNRYRGGGRWELPQMGSSLPAMFGPTVPRAT
jgi:hypothetical protein